QRILSRQTLSSDDARIALVYTRAFAKKCTSPHVSKGDTRVSGQTSDLIPPLFTRGLLQKSRMHKPAHE
ncbi:MAG: hypothetical protein ACRD6X_07765, partial [Pyrinomonadaceae bacterium]